MQTLYIDQYHNIFWARTRAELSRQIPGRVSKMYVDKKDGSVSHVGYIIGQHWLTAYRPYEKKD